LRDEDYVISMAIISAEYIRENDEEAGDLPNLLAISEKRYGKRSPISAYPVNVPPGRQGCDYHGIICPQGKKWQP
jgi:hypothetical protein